MGTMIKRAIREDVFVIGHDPWHTYGDFMFAIKQGN